MGEKEGIMGPELAAVTRAVAEEYGVADLAKGISPKKVGSARLSWAAAMAVAEKPVYQVDTSFLQNGTAGVLVTDKCVYSSDCSPIALTSIQKVECVGTEFGREVTAFVENGPQKGKVRVNGIVIFSGPFRQVALLGRLISRLTKLARGQRRGPGSARSVGSSPIDQLAKAVRETPVAQGAGDSSLPGPIGVVSLGEPAVEREAGTGLRQNPDEAAEAKALIQAERLIAAGICSGFPDAKIIKRLRLYGEPVMDELQAMSRMRALYARRWVAEIVILVLALFFLGFTLSLPFISKWSSGGEFTAVSLGGIALGATFFVFQLFRVLTGAKIAHETLVRWYHEKGQKAP